jgi:hypothetical protein
VTLDLVTHTPATLDLATLDPKVLDVDLTIRSSR